MGEPIVEMLPLRDKNFVNKFIIPLVVDSLYTLYGIEQVPMRFVAILQGKQKFRPENLIVFLELLVFTYIAPTIWVKSIKNKFIFKIQFEYANVFQLAIGIIVKARTQYKLLI